jgi:hypothetical protein
MQVRGPLRQPAPCWKLLVNKFDDGGPMVVYGSIHQSATLKVDGPENQPSPFVSESDQVSQGLKMKLVADAGSKVARDRLVTHDQLDLGHWIKRDFREGFGQGGVKFCLQGIGFHVELSRERQSRDLSFTILVAFHVMNVNGIRANPLKSRCDGL